MNKTLIRLILLAVCLVFGACNDTKTYRIGVSQCSDDDWRNKMNSEIQREMMFHPEATVEIRSADDSSEKQIKDIEYFIDNDFDIIIAAPNEAEALTPIISEAYNKGIPILVFDRNVIGDDFTAWQGADNISIGKAAGEHAIEMVGHNAPTIEIYGLHGSTPADERHEGFNSVEGVKVVGLAYGNWNYQDAYVAADSLLALHPETKLVYAHNDRMAIAAADVARKRGLTPYIIGIDGAPEIGMKAVADSVIDATFIYPTEGQMIINTALSILNGEPYNKITSIPTLPVVNKSNAKILLSQNEDLKKETKRMELLKTQVDEYWEEQSSQKAIFYAIFAIVLLLFGFLFMVLRSFWVNRKYQAALIKQYKLVEEERDKQKILIEQLDAATSSKLAFFTNVSHDLRTPLSLICEPVELLADSPRIDDSERFLMKIARKNVKILQRLINQILDFRKYESGKMEIVLTETEMRREILDWAAAFEALAKRRGIDFSVEFDDDSDIPMAIDIDKMERVFYNLVSNAFKYTPNGGRINIKCSGSDDSFTMIVSDTGKGIPSKDIANIFDHFFQVEKVNPAGSGIGLPLSKAFVELHGGTISVESLEGLGTRFIVRLPVVHVAESAPPPQMRSSDTIAEILRPIEETEGNLALSPDQPTVLVIDDNSDIRALLREILKKDYAVLTAENGEEGLQLAMEYAPDLIISDVMMPVMDGIEMCRRVKADVRTSHIPVLMLTACALDEQRVEGYDVGADGYLAKPFNSKVLISRCRNLIEGRHRILNLWTGDRPANDKAIAHDENTPSEEKQAELSVIDNEFYRKFIDLFSSLMSNPDIDVESMASSLGMGYSQLYRKLKSITGHRPVELMRLLRLEKAREMLRKSDKTVSEISYEVGFSTPAYFTRCYREKYGVTPSEEREK